MKILYWLSSKTNDEFYYFQLMEQSIFLDKENPPRDKDLQERLGNSYSTWKNVQNYISEQCPEVGVEWHFSKAGWNCRIKDKKRVIVYLMPCADFFNASFVLGKNAVAKALAGNIAETFKQTIKEAKTYTEGTGFRLAVKTNKSLADLQTLIDLKLE